MAIDEKALAKLVNTAMAQGYALAKVDEEALDAEKVKTAGLELTVSRLRIELQAQKDLMELERARFDADRLTDREQAVAAREAEMNALTVQWGQKIANLNSDLQSSKAAAGKLNQMLTDASKRATEQEKIKAEIKARIAHALDEMLGASWLIRLVAGQAIGCIIAKINTGGFDK